MPNWATTEVNFAGDAETIRKIKAAFQTDHPFQTLRPCPQDLLDTTSGFCGHGTPEQAALEAKEQANLATYGYKNWYDWRNANWGTKWDANAISIESLDTLVFNFKVRFDTAWEPPDQLLIYLTEMYEGLNIVGWYSLDEDGHNIAYNFDVSAGVLTEGSQETVGDSGWDDDEDQEILDTTGQAARLPLP